MKDLFQSLKVALIYWQHSKSATIIRKKLLFYKYRLLFTKKRFKQLISLERKARIFKIPYRKYFAINRPIQFGEYGLETRKEAKHKRIRKAIISYRTLKILGVKE